MKTKPFSGATVRQFRELFGTKAEYQKAVSEMTLKEQQFDCEYAFSDATQRASVEVIVVLEHHVHVLDASTDTGHSLASTTS